MKIEKDCFHCRVVMLGNTQVGKTTILNRLLGGPHIDAEPTVGANYQLYVREIDKRKIEIQIWDTAGQEKYRSLGPIYFRNALGAVVVYDVTNLASFNALDGWIKAFQDVAGKQTVIAIVGNKKDRDDIVVDCAKAEQWAEHNNYIHATTSAVTGEGIAEVFRDLSERLLRTRADQLDGLDVAQKERSNCC